MSDTQAFARNNGKVLSIMISSGSRIVDGAQCIYVAGRFWDLAGCEHIVAGDRVSIPAQCVSCSLLIEFLDETGTRHDYRVLQLGTSAHAESHSPAQSLPARPQPWQTTASAASPDEAQQSTSALPRRLRNQGRTGPKPSRPVHSGSVKSMKRRAWRFSVSDFNAQSLATRKPF